MKKKLIAGLMTALVCFMTCASASFATEYDYSSFVSTRMEEKELIVDLKDDSIYFKQSMRGRCTLAANVMMVRRARILMGDENWADATESTVGAVAWRNGMAWNYSYGGVTVTYQAGHVSTDDMKALLEEHPEGVVIYDRSIPHAICLTDYDEEEDVFYCADSATGFPEGRIPVDEALIHMNSISAIWYVVETDQPIETEVEVQVPIIAEDAIQ